MNKRADLVETAGSRLAVIGVTAGLEHAVVITPVDTSEALSNWQVFLNNPAPDNIPPYFMGKKGSTRGASIKAAIGAGKAELAYKKPGQPVFLSNLAPHIGKLDQGSSSQFAGGFTPRIVLAIRLAIEKAADGGEIFKGMK